MTKQISQAQFEALKLEAHSITTERDVEFSYENLFNADGEEIAFATFHSHRDPVFLLREA